MRVSVGSGGGAGRQLGQRRRSFSSATVWPQGELQGCGCLALGRRLGSPPHRGRNTEAPVSVDRRVEREGQLPSRVLSTFTSVVST